MILVYVTYSSLEEAKRITALLLEKKLIACATFFPAESMYIWGEGMVSDKEVVSFIKTNEENWKELRREFATLHSYEVPCILRLQVHANADYESWVNTQCHS